MRKFASLLSVFLLALASMAVSISAQDATPPEEPWVMPDSFEIEPGIVVDNMIFSEDSVDPVKYRLTFDAGVVYEVMPSPNLELIYMETGSLVMTLDAAVIVTQLGDADSGGELFEAGTDVTVEQGYYFVLQPGVAGEVRNEGSEPAVVSISGMLPAAGEMDGPDATPDASPEG